MALSIGKSISYPQQDAQVWKKTAIGTLLMAPGSILLLPPLVSMGYTMRILKESMDGKEDTRLPEWRNMGDLMVQGLFGFLIGLVCMLPFSILGAVALIPQMGKKAAKGLTVTAMIGLPLKLAALVLFVGGLALMPILLARYVRTGSLAATFNFRQIGHDIKRSLNDYVVMAALLVMTYVAIGFAGQFLTRLPLIGWLGYLLIVGLSFYAAMIFSHWTGRLYRAYFINVESPVHVHNPLAPSEGGLAQQKQAAKGSMRRLRDGVDEEFDNEESV